MGTLYHKHAIFTTYTSNQTCGTINGHHASCSKHGLTNANETGCVVDPQDATRCKCTHEVPDSMIARLPRDEFTIVSKGRVSKVRKVASKKAKGKKKAAKSKTRKKKATR